MTGVLQGGPSGHSLTCTFRSFRKMHLRIVKVFSRGAEQFVMEEAELSARRLWHEITGAEAALHGQYGGGGGGGIAIAAEEKQLLDYELFTDTLFAYFFSYLTGIESAEVFQQCMIIVLDEIRQKEEVKEAPPPQPQRAAKKPRKKAGGGAAYAAHHRHELKPLQQVRPTLGHSLPSARRHGGRRHDHRRTQTLS
jgi:hypothetical protein